MTIIRLVEKDKLLGDNCAEVVKRTNITMIEIEVTKEKMKRFFKTGEILLDVDLKIFKVG